MPSPNLRLTGVVQTLVTGATNGSAVVLVAICNTNVTTEYHVDVWVVPSAGSTSTSNQLIAKLIIPPEDTYFYNEKILLAQGETIQMQSSVANEITVTTSYLDL